MIYDDELIRAIRNKLAPDMMTTLQSASALEIYAPMESVRVPLYAGVDVAFKRGLASFTVKATVKHGDSDKCLYGEHLFSTRELYGSRDRAQVLEYLFEQLKRKMIHELADEKLRQLIGVAP